MICNDTAASEPYSDRTSLAASLGQERREFFLRWTYPRRAVTFGHGQETSKERKTACPTSGKRAGSDQAAQGLAGPNPIHADRAGPGRQLGAGAPLLAGRPTHSQRCSQVENEPPTGMRFVR